MGVRKSIPIMYIKDAIRSLIDLFEAHENKIKTRIYNVGQILPSQRLENFWRSSINIFKRLRFPSSPIRRPWKSLNPFQDNWTIRMPESSGVGQSVTD